MVGLDFNRILSRHLGQKAEVSRVIPISGGSVNKAARLVSSAGEWFVKWNNQSDMFRKEAIGLNLLSNTGVVKVPEILGEGDDSGFSYLLMEYISAVEGSKKSWRLAGENLAMLHKTSNELYGLDSDNYMGSVIQKNTPDKSWVSFFSNCRLIPLAQKSFELGLLGIRDLGDFEKLCSKLENLLPEEKPSLVHGDLWSGNLIFSENYPIFIDPAVYFGHREVDLAMTRLFGGFPVEFYEAYTENFPMETGLEERADIYNLYPLLIHLLLFGRSYLAEIRSILKRFE